MEYTLAASPDDLIRGRARVGQAEIVVCTDGTALFDGGAMFGVVPRTLWQQHVTPDAQNRIAIGLNCVVVRLGGRTVLIETGFGNKLSAKFQAICGLDGGRGLRLPASLAAAGIAPEHVDFVINSHLHWDHCGWNTVLDGAGTPHPFFPRAVYVTHAGEVEHGRRQLERDRISYVPHNYEPLLAEGRMRLVHTEPGSDGDLLCPGIRLRCRPGHTPHMLTVEIESDGEHACFVSDLVPTTSHFRPTWVMAFDLDPLRTIEEKKAFYGNTIAQQSLLLFPHDHGVCMRMLPHELMPSLAPQGIS